jgi:hypothetical protein
MKPQQILPIVLLITIIALPFLSQAQPPGFGGGDDVLDVPVDGGLSVLVAAGVGYGIKKVKQKRVK